MAPLSGPRVAGPIPGPRSRELLDRQEQRESNARTYPRRLPIAIARAEGPFIEDLDGNIFLDFLTGAGVLALGHNHPEVVEAVRRQLDVLCHGLDFPTEAKDEFISVQLGLLPAEFRDRAKVLFCGPAGANAVDAALKLCKTATGRSEVIAFQGAFHGSTHSAMAVTGMVSQKEPVQNFMHGVHFFPYPNAYRSAVSPEGGPDWEACLHYFRSALEDPLGGITRPAAVIMEMIQAEGGVVPAPTGFVRGVREVTAELGIPLIVDEIQTGCGRTGTWFAFEQHGIVPDVVLASKAIGGIGMPIAVMFYDESLDVWASGAHTGTFRGNQLAYVAGTAAARIIQRDGILEHVRELGVHAFDVLQGLRRENPAVGDVRGVGLMLGVEIVEPGTSEPDGEGARRVQRAALENGLIVELGGRHDAVVRLLPPLNIARETLDVALGILERAFSLALAEQLVA